jgi:hypothetical protein
VKKVIFTPRHTKLVELNESIGVLLLGQKNKDYINYLKDLKKKTVEELKKEEAKARIIEL